MKTFNGFQPGRIDFCPRPSLLKQGTAKRTLNVAKPDPAQRA